jgi:hypothetical protein
VLPLAVAEPEPLPLADSEPLDAPVLPAEPLSDPVLPAEPLSDPVLPEPLSDPVLPAEPLADAVPLRAPDGAPELFSLAAPDADREALPVAWLAEASVLAPLLVCDPEEELEQPARRPARTNVVRNTNGACLMVPLPQRE